MGYVVNQMKDTATTRFRQGTAVTRILRSRVIVPLLAVGATLSWVTLRAEEPPHSSEIEATSPQEQVQDAEEALEKAFAKAGIQVDRAASAVAFPVTAEVRAEYLEYVLVNPHGAIHESLLVTPVGAQVLGAAFLSIGAEAGKNVEYVAKVPPPTPEEARAGAKTHDTIVPSGKPLYLYVAWRESAGVPDLATGEFPGETLHFHRLEDLIVDQPKPAAVQRICARREA